MAVPHLQLIFVFLRLSYRRLFQANVYIQKAKAMLRNLSDAANLVVAK